MKISVFGTGYVGLVTALSGAHWGHSVVGIDVDQIKVHTLNDGIPTFFEQGIGELLRENIANNRVSFSTDWKKAIDSEIIFLCLPTPQNDDGSANMECIYSCLEQLFTLKSNAILVIKSTVPVGTYKKVTQLQKNKNSTFTFVSNPEFLRQGKAVDDSLYPQRIIIGSDDEDAKKSMRIFYHAFDDSVPYLEMDPISAELVKYAANSFLATKISFINEIALLSEKIGANIDFIREGIGLDRRIGKEFLNAGIGYGGSCFPKDVSALVESGNEKEIHLSILDAAQNVNAKMQNRFVNKILDWIDKHDSPKTISLLGLAFKPETDDIRDAPAINIIRKLTTQHISINAYDPHAMTKVKLLNLPRLNLCDNAVDTFADSCILVVTTEWPEFMTDELSKKIINSQIKVIFDGRNCMSHLIGSGIKVIQVGK